MPTVAELSGAPARRGLDGVSIAPLLRGGQTLKRDYFYWEFHEGGFSQAVRFDDWKAVRNRRRTAPIGVYDLATDESESHDLAASRPEFVSRAAALFSEAHKDSKEFPVQEQA